jgi:hypothetical protein
MKMLERWMARSSSCSLEERTGLCHLLCLISISGIHKFIAACLNRKVSFLAETRIASNTLSIADYFAIWHLGIVDRSMPCN